MSFIFSFFQSNALTILFLSILAIIVSNFFATTYRIAFMAIAILALCTSVYLKGGADEKASHDKKTAELQLKVEKLNKERTKITSKSAAEHDKNRRLILENGKLKDINEYLSTQEVAGCTIPDGFIRLHNESAGGKLDGISGAAIQFDDKAGQSTSETVNRKTPRLARPGDSNKQ